MGLISSDADLATLDHLESLRNRGAVPISKSQGELHSRKRRSYLLSASPLALVLVRLDYSAPNCPDDLSIAGRWQALFWVFDRVISKVVFVDS